MINLSLIAINELKYKYINQLVIRFIIQKVIYSTDNKTWMKSSIFVIC